MPLRNRQGRLEAQDRSPVAAQLPSSSRAHVVCHPPCSTRRDDGVLLRRFVAGACRGDAVALPDSDMLRDGPGLPELEELLENERLLQLGAHVPAIQSTPAGILKHESVRKSENNARNLPDKWRGGRSILLINDTAGWAPGDLALCLARDREWDNGLVPPP